MLLKNTVEKFQNSLKNEMHIFAFAQSVPKMANSYSPGTSCCSLPVTIKFLIFEIRLFHEKSFYRLEHFVKCGNFT